MPPLVTRILLHGLLAAGVLAAGGLLIAELGGMYVAAGATVRMGDVEPGTPAAGPANVSEVTSTLRSRVPLTLAAWGFAFVAVGEVVRHLIRRPKPTPPPNPREDTAEVLLNELLRQADEQRARAVSAAKVAPSPSPPDDHNTPERPA